MSKELQWSGGTHAFDLTSRRVSWRMLQAQHPFPGQYGSTPAACLKRFDEGVYSPDDIERVIRFGLIGGGMSDDEADKLVFEHVRGKPMASNAAFAFQVLATLFMEVTDAGAVA